MVRLTEAQEQLLLRVANQASECIAEVDLVGANPTTRQPLHTLVRGKFVTAVIVGSHVMICLTDAGRAAAEVIRRKGTNA